MRPRGSRRSLRWLRSSRSGNGKGDDADGQIEVDAVDALLPDEPAAGWRERPRGTGGGKPGAAVIEARDIDRYVREQLRRQRQTWPGGESPFVTQKRGITTTAELKSQTYGRLRYLADRQQLVIPREADLLRELAALRVELRPGGSVGIEAATGRDDVADAAMLACAPYRQRGSWRSLLTDFAERPVPETPVASLNEPIVATGGRLRVYRRPPLQSVNGNEVTFPPTTARADRRAPESALVPLIPTKERE